MNNREQQLLQLRFEKIEHQQTFYLHKYDSTWYVDFWRITDYTNQRWELLIEEIKYELKQARNRQEQEELYVLGFNSAQKEFKKQLLDKLNHYKSNLQEETNPKLNKSIKQDKVKELEIRIETIKELMKCT